MKVRYRILAVGLLAGGLLVAAPGTAGASETLGSCLVDNFQEIVGDQIPAELTEQQSEELNQAAEDCQEAPNPIVPEVNEIIWGTLFFAVVLLALVKWAFPALRKGMQQREDKIRGDLEEAEHARQQGQQELDQYRRQLANSREEAARILEEARESADRVRQERIAAVEEEAADVRRRAEDDLRVATERATADLQSQVGELAIELAEKVVAQSLDRETQMALIDRYIEEVGSERP
jgi:F-type H+-transporting ATPase subunit b